MVSFSVRMRFAREDRDAVTEILHELALASRQEPGCVTYIPNRIEDDPDTVLIFEQYSSQLALEHHRETPHFKRLAVGGLYQLMRERVVENLTAVV